MDGDKGSTPPQASSSATHSNSVSRSPKSSLSFDLSPPSTSSFLSRHFQFLNEDDDEDRFMIQRNQILQMLQDVINRYNDCFGLLRRAITEIEVLRGEKMELASEFLEMSRMIEENRNGHGGGGGGGEIATPGKENVPPNPPTPALVVGGNGDRAACKRSVPKSISVRSRGFLAVKNPIANEGDGEGSSSGSDAKLPHRLLVPVPGQVEGEEAIDGSGLELEVYDQGMAKTELCNKWEEMAWCPYGSQCQFAHGMAELRPVIRHPRYKTQLCRMVTAPGGCPYGHRCHFRHAMDNPDN